MVTVIIPRTWSWYVHCCERE